MKNYYNLQLGNNCPQCVDNPCVILLEASTGKLFEHCGICRRSWDFTRTLTHRASERAEKYIQEYNRSNNSQSNPLVGTKNYKPYKH